MQIKQWLLILFSVSLFTTQAQQKNLTDDQYFKNDLKDLVQPLPRTGKWVSNKRADHHRRSHFQCFKCRYRYKKTVHKCSR